MSTSIPTPSAQLAREVDNIRYIKDTSADMAQAGQLIHRYGDVISTFVGWDSLLLAALTEGAAGVMAGTANVMPAQLVSIHRAADSRRPGPRTTRVGTALSR